MKEAPYTQFTLWRSENLYNIDFAAYSLSHHHFPRHFHDHYVIELVLNGIDSFYCNGKSYKAIDNQMVFINPGEVHTGSTVSHTPLHYFSLYPDRKSLEQIADVLNITLPADFSFSQTVLPYTSLTEKFRRLYTSLSSSNNILEHQEVFIDCMQALLQQPGSKHDADTQRDKRVDILVDFIHTYFKEDITLQQMAELVRLNPFHLIRVFKQAIGLSPYEYLLIVRTEYSKQLLRKGYKVQDAALDSGFYDASHFNRMFRRIAATSPKAFRSSKSQYHTILKKG